MNKTKIKKENKPVYTIGIVSEMIGVTEQTIRLYEKKGLIKPARRNKHRYFSDNDVAWLMCIRDAIHKDKISIEGLIKLLHYAPCWEIRECPDMIKRKCCAFYQQNIPCWEAKNKQCTLALKEGCENCSIYKIAMVKKAKGINTIKEENDYVKRNQTDFSKRRQATTNG
ncbi:MAG TPA: MerR family transcriptional regulator [Nitrospirae bacterium]|nr:MerR family transcriptional regulator [Nitrospirota bacterium]